MLNYEVYENARRKTIHPSVSAYYSLFFVDAETSRTIIRKTLRGEFPDLDVGTVMDQYDKHFYIQIDLSWMEEVRLGQVYGGISARAREMVPSSLMDARSAWEERGQTGDTWLLGEFSTLNIIDRSIEAAIRIVTGYIINGLLHQKHMIVERSSKRSVRESIKGRPRYRTIYLSDAAKRYAHRETSAGTDGYGGWKMPEYEVRKHKRVLSDGRVIEVRGHKRGDPAIPRKTIPVQVKL